MTLLTADDVLNKKFQATKFREGYEQDEVDEFLETVTYVSQSQGYYSGVLFSDEYASIYIPALMREYTRMSFTHFNFLSQLKTNPQYILSITDISTLPVRTLLKNIGKKLLHPFPFLYKITAKIWRKLRT